MAARFILYHPAKIRGQRAKFYVKDGETGNLVFGPVFKRQEAEEKQKELNSPPQQQAAAA
jgi:hypothetical protein